MIGEELGTQRVAVLVPPVLVFAGSGMSLYSFSLGVVLFYKFLSAEVTLYSLFSSSSSTNAEASSKTSFSIRLSMLALALMKAESTALALPAHHAFLYAEAQDFLEQFHKEFLPEKRRALDMVECHGSSSSRS
ncbi:hypothetical protein LDL59_06465 [Kaistella anthropi]|nr:hypothetical protein [Kaistella anthropi]